MIRLRTKSLLIAGLAISLAPNLPGAPQDGNAAPRVPSQNPAEKASPSPEKNPTQSTPQNQPTPAAGIERTQPVITIHGLCDQSATNTATDGGSCTTVVTREQFEYLLASINITGQVIPPDKRLNLAQAYVQFLAFERAARKAGLEDTPQFAEIMRWMRLRTISDVYRHKLQEESKSLSQEEIDAYYKGHLPSYDRIGIARILIPRKNPTGQEDKEFDQKASEVAKTVRERAAKGEDPELVQKDAYAALGMASAPPTDMGTRKRSDFLAEESAELFTLQPGEVSKVETESTSYVIYKVNTKETLPESRVKDEILHTISQQKFNDAFQSITQSVQPEYNQTYFGAPGAAPAPKPSVASPHPHQR